MHKTIALIVFVMIGQSLIAQQVIELNEDDVDMTILTWHYRKYENSQNGQWSVTAHEGEGVFRAKFTFQAEQYEAMYDDKGFILAEKKYVNLESVPDPVLKLLDYRIVKYKIESFTRESLFENRKPIQVNYRVDARTKTGGVVILWFDENFQVLEKNLDDKSIW